MPRERLSKQTLYAEVDAEKRPVGRPRTRYLDEYPDNSRMDTVPKYTIPKDKIPNGYHPQWTPSRMDTIPNGQHPKCTPSWMSTYIVTELLNTYA